MWLKAKGTFNHVAFLCELFERMLVDSRLFDRGVGLEFNYFRFIPPTVNHYLPFGECGWVNLHDDDGWPYRLRHYRLRGQCH